MADAKTEKQKVKEITDKLEEGLKELFGSEKYKSYLSTMSKFHNYSVNNTLLIALQRPDASLVADRLSYFSDKNPYALFIVILLKICFIEKSEKTQVVFSDNFLHRH